MDTLNQEAINHLTSIATAEVVKLELEEKAKPESEQLSGELKKKLVIAGLKETLNQYEKTGLALYHTVDQKIIKFPPIVTLVVDNLIPYLSDIVEWGYLQANSIPWFNRHKKR